MKRFGPLTLSVLLAALGALRPVYAQTKMKVVPASAVDELILPPPLPFVAASIDRTPLETDQRQLFVPLVDSSAAPHVGASIYQTPLGQTAAAKPHNTAPARVAQSPAQSPSSIPLPVGPNVSGDLTPETVPTPVPQADQLFSPRFPDVPPNPDAEHLEPLPPLEEELSNHGGSYLYAPEGDRLGWPAPEEKHTAPYHLLRLPENYIAPQPLTFFQEFLGADPIRFHPNLKWFGNYGFTWEPRFVGYGSYEFFSIAFDQGDAEQQLIGHQLLVDLDLRLTGTERMHMQFRPLGERNTGGSYYQLNDPQGYVSNATAAPDRWWVEGELYSLFGNWIDSPYMRDWHVVAGKFPFALHNQLLMNDDITGVVVNKNTLLVAPTSNINMQLFLGIDDVDAFDDVGAEVAGTHVSIDWRRAFIELTYAYLHDSAAGSRNAQYIAGSATKFYGPLSLAGRAMFKFGDDAGLGDGSLFVLESNYTRLYDHGLMHAVGIEEAVYYANAFHATAGWSPISGGNFDRLRSVFEVDPLVRIAQGVQRNDTAGVSLGVQLFRHHQDESIIPEIAIEAPDGEGVYGIGLRYLRKTGHRSFFDMRGIRTWSSDDSLARWGLFTSQTILF